MKKTKPIKKTTWKIPKVSFMELSQPKEKED